MFLLFNCAEKLSQSPHPPILDCDPSHSVASLPINEPSTRWQSWSAVTQKDRIPTEPRDKCEETSLNSHVTCSDRGLQLGYTLYSQLCSQSGLKLHINNNLWGLNLFLYKVIGLKGPKILTSKIFLRQKST